MINQEALALLLFLVHHADAVSAQVDTQRPLSITGRAHAEALADRARTAGAAPAAIWHSGKLRARQTAEQFLRCNPFAEFKMVRGLRPDDSPVLFREEMRGETRDLLVVGHQPQLSGLLSLLTGVEQAFPLHGLVALETNDEGESWVEVWRL